MLALITLGALVASASARMSLPIARTSSAPRTQGPAMRRLAKGKVVINQFEDAQYTGNITLGSPPQFVFAPPPLLARCRPRARLVLTPPRPRTRPAPASNPHQELQGDL